MFWPVSVINCHIAVFEPTSVMALFILHTFQYSFDTVITLVTPGILFI